MEYEIKGILLGGIGMVSEWGIGDYIIITGEQGQNEIKTRRNEYIYKSVYFGRGICYKK